MSDCDPNIIVSGLSRAATVDEATVDEATFEVQIYRLEDDPQSTLEVINDKGTPTVWEALFDTVDEAFAAFELTVEGEGMEAFFDRESVIPFPRRH